MTSYFRQSIITILVVAISSMIVFDAPRVQAGKGKETPKPGFMDWIAGRNVGPKRGYADAEWNALKVKWHFGVKLYRGGGFLNRGYINLPMSKYENEKGEWVKIDKKESCVDGLFPGFRLGKKIQGKPGKAEAEKVVEEKDEGGSGQIEVDPSAVLILDRNGYIAGLQSWIPKDVYEKAHHKDDGKDSLNEANSESPRRTEQWYIEEGDRLVQTVYFTDPETVCKGRKKKAFDKHGVGANGLWIMKGQHGEYEEIPMNEAELNKDEWNNGKCYSSMGQHYWYGIKRDMKCDDFVPFCLMYNRGRLTGMCFANTVPMTGAYYDEPSPTYSNLQKLMDPVPMCFKDEPAYTKLSSVHVFFREDAVHNSQCPQ